MPTKPKRKTRGIVATVRRHGQWPYSDFAIVCRGEKFRPSTGATICWHNLLRAGCPRLKPGEVKKVRVIIEEVKPERDRR